MSETTTTAPVIVAHALVPVSLRIDMSTGEGARFAQLVPEDQRDEYMHRFIYDHVRDLLRAGSQRGDGKRSNPEGEIGPRALLVTLPSIQVDRETGEPILSPEQTLAVLEVRSALGLLDDEDDTSR